MDEFSVFDSSSSSSSDSDSDEENDEVQVGVEGVTTSGENSYSSSDESCTLDEGHHNERNKTEPPRIDDHTTT